MADDNGSFSLDGPEEILCLLREQASLYSKLDSLSMRQRSLVTGDDVGSLLRLLADRQRLSERLTRIAERLAPARQNWAAYRDWLAPAEREEADRLLGESGQRLRRVIQCDEEDARVLSGRKEAAARALRATHATGRAVAAYGVEARPAGRFDCVDDGA